MEPGAVPHRGLILAMLLGMTMPAAADSAPRPPGGEPPSAIGDRYSSALENCVERGGTVTHGLFDRTYCRILFPDGGKRCTDGSQCIGDCIYRPPRGSGFQTPRGRVAGICQPDNFLYGCLGKVSRGRVTRMICLD